MTVFTGVSGSGKNSIVFDTIASEATRQLNQTYSTFIQTFLPKYTKADFIAIKNLSPANVVDQKSLYATRRSNMLTYTGIFDRVRTIFEKKNGVDKALFSFNSKGGCPECKGEGVVVTDLAYLEGVELVCPVCDGNRYIPEVLEMKYQDKTILDILELSVEEGLSFFTDKAVQKTLKSLDDVGLSYLSLGQPLDTLSGGECQRVKLASELHKSGHVYILDEPTTGLHMSDIETFMKIVDALVDKGSTVIIIEHNIEVMRQADWIIDLGPEAGHRGGTILYSGEPKGLKSSSSLSAQYLFR